VAAADLILTIGYDPVEYAPQKWNLAGTKPIVHIDAVPADIYTHYTPAIEVIGDVATTIGLLQEQLRNTSLAFDPTWYLPIRQRILDDIASYALTEGDALTIPGTLNVIRECLPDDGLLISDVGSHKLWTVRNFLTYTPNSVIIANGLCSMGIALPGAIAAALLYPHRQIVAVMGDGGFLMNSQELETAKRLGVGFTAVVLNDFDYGLISWKQRLSRGRTVSPPLGNPDFKAYAESFGIKGYRPQHVAELKEQLHHAITSHALCVVEVQVDASVNTALVDKLSAYWAYREGRGETPPAPHENTTLV
jgi:acetolactate synthase-1/2/3 large subunit